MIDGVFFPSPRRQRRNAGEKRRQSPKVPGPSAGGIKKRKVPISPEGSVLFGPSDWIRTSGLMLPKHPRYQLRYTRKSVRRNLRPSVSAWRRKLHIRSFFLSRSNPLTPGFDLAVFGCIIPRPPLRSSMRASGGLTKKRGNAPGPGKQKACRGCGFGLRSGGLPAPRTPTPAPHPDGRAEVSGSPPRSIIPVFSGAVKPYWSAAGAQMQ